MPKSAGRYSDPPGSPLPSEEAAAPRSDRLCQNPWEEAALKNRLHCYGEIYPAGVCLILVLVVWAFGPVDTLPAGAGRNGAVPALAFAGARVCFDPASGFCGNCHRVVECNGYTCASPGKGKMDTLRTQNRGGDFRHSGGPHGVFQLLDSLVA